MNHAFSERIGMGALLLSLILPFLTTQLLAASGEKRPGKKGIRLIRVLALAVNLCVNTAALFLAWKRLCGAAFSPARLMEILRMEGSYQEIWQIVKTAMAGMAVSVAAGLGMRMILQPGARFRIPRAAAGKLMLIAAFQVLVILWGSDMSLQAARHLRLTEICRRTTAIVNSRGRMENRWSARGEELCYVSVTNEGSLIFNANQMYLSDEEENLKKYPLGEITVSPGETWTVTAAYNHLIDFQENGHTEVFLADGQGKLLDHITVPVLAEEESYVRRKGETPAWQIRSNQPAGPADEIPEPVFSRRGGYYDQPFDLELSAEAGSRIYYTLDGGNPGPETLLYGQPIRVENRSGEPNRFRSVPNVVTDWRDRQREINGEPVDKATVVRAVAVDSQGRTSGIVTQTYFVGLDQYREKTVVSIAADPEDFFGEDGIYVTGKEYDAWYEANAEWISTHPKREYDWIWEDEPEPNFMKRGDAWERSGNVELLRGREELNQPAGFRISGSSSRDSFFKRLNVYAREAYSGSSLFRSQIFEEKATHSFTLRDGFLNAFVPSLVAGRDLAVLQGIPTAVFLNGEYWGDCYLCEKYHDSFFASTYGVRESNVRFLKISRDSRMTEDERSLYESEFTDFFREKDLADPKNYEDFCRRADVQSYIDFLCTNLYVNNEDMTDTQNILLWRVNEPEGEQEKDGRWRWGLYDMDLRWGEIREAQGVGHDYEANTFSVPIPHIFYGMSYADQPMYQALRRSQVFCRQFVLTFMDLANTVFEPEAVLERLARWGVTGGEYAEFFARRPEYIIPYLAEEFGLKGTLETVKVTVNFPEAGKVVLNTVTPDLSGGAWSGRYYTDYPISLEAKEEEGYSFVGWEIGGEIIREPVTETEVKRGGTEIHAIFERR